MSATSLPDAAVLVQAARDAMTQAPVIPGNPAKTTAGRRRAASRTLDQWKPAIDQYADLAAAAEFLGIAYSSARRKQYPSRTRADGTREWPEPDDKFGRSPVWKYRTLVIARAEAPGHGHPGMPGRRARTARQDGA